MSSSSSFVIDDDPYHETWSPSSCASSNISSQESYSSQKKLSRKQRSVVSNDGKDLAYWSQRTRVERRMNDAILETRLTQLHNENETLRAKIDMLRRKFGFLSSDEIIQLKHASAKSTDQSSTEPHPSLCTTEHISLPEVLLNS